jgi:hypothetical protein
MIARFNDCVADSVSACGNQSVAIIGPATPSADDKLGIWKSRA